MATISNSNVPLFARGRPVTDPNSANTSAANTAAVVTILGQPNRAICVQGLEFAYNATPTAGALTIDFGGVSLPSIPITSSGPGFLPSIYKAPANTTVNVTLAAGGASVSGFVRVDQLWLD